MLSNYGCALMQLHISGEDGYSTDVVLGYDTPEEYVRDVFFLGVVVGRVAGRIAGGLLELDGQEYPLPVPDTGHHLHGGVQGLGKRAWQVAAQDDSSIRFHYDSEDGEQGYPGRLALCVEYTLTDDNAFVVRYAAEADRQTVVSPTQHSYFNLGGHAAGVILDHELTIDADEFVPVDEELIPRGGSVPVAGTAMDFREPRNLRQQLAQAGTQIDVAGGFDHSWLLDTDRDWRSSPAAQVREPRTGRQLAVYTDRPALHVFSGNTGGDGIRGKEGVLYGPRHGFCLETQHVPTPRFDASAAAVCVSPDRPFASETRFVFTGF